MDTFVQICEIISGISAAIAIIISISLYVHGLNRERKHDTLNRFAEIRNNYFNTKHLDDKEKLKYLNELEYFATGINNKVYDIKIVKLMSGNRMIRQYNDFIQLRRSSRYGNENAYNEYEKMIEKLK